MALSAVRIEKLTGDETWNGTLETVPTVGDDLEISDVDWGTVQSRTVVIDEDEGVYWVVYVK